MNKSDIINEVAKVTCAAEEASDAVEEFLNSVKRALLRGERVTISEFGSFFSVVRKAKKGRNPATGESVLIPPKKVVKFKPSPKLNDRL